MLKCIEESTSNAFIKYSKGIATKANAVSTKCNLQFPNRLLLLFSENGKKAQVTKITCLHTFESAPQYQIGVAYEVIKGNGEPIYLILIFSVITKQFQAILRCE